MKVSLINVECMQRKKLTIFTIQNAYISNFWRMALRMALFYDHIFIVRGIIHADATGTYPIPNPNPLQ